MINTTTMRTEKRPPESVARVRLHGILAGMMCGHCRIHDGSIWRGFSPFLGGKGFTLHSRVLFGLARRSASVEKLLHNEDYI